MPRKPKSGKPNQVEIAKVEARTERSMHRWSKLPWVTGPGAAVGIAWMVAGETTRIDLNLVANVGLSLVAPAWLGKYLWDRQQKVRQRKRMDELEKENETLRAVVSEQRGRLDEVRAQLGRGQTEERTT